MSILFLVSSMEGGGAERVAALLCNAWAKRGEQVTLMPTFSGRGDVCYPLSEQVNLHFLADEVGAKAGRMARIRALRKYIRKNRPDIIISFLPHVNIAALAATVGTGVPVIACERTYPPRLSPPLPKTYTLLRRVLYKRAALLVAQSEDTEKWFSGHFRRTPTAKIPNPIVVPIPRADPQIPPDEVLKPAQKLLLSVGRLDDAKRAHMLIEAFSRIAARHLDWDLGILGEGDTRAQLEEQVKALGLEGRVHLPGRVGNLDDWYRRADLFCLPSSYEGFPNVLLEAMAYGVPSIAFDIKSGPRDIMDGGRLGVLLPDNDHVERLAEALQALSADPEKRAELAAHAMEIRETYASESILAMWDEAIQRAVGNKS